MLLMQSNKNFTLQSIGSFVLKSCFTPSPCLTSYATSASSQRWKDRQSKDFYTRKAKVEGLKGRAAFKLLQLNEKYKLFKPGLTVVDLGFAPGSWSQVAVSCTSPGGRVIGVDVLPVQPPRGVSSIQGDMLSPHVQAEVRAYLESRDRGRFRSSTSSTTIFDQSKQAIESSACVDRSTGRLVDIVLSDMSAPWLQTDGFYSNSISDPYNRMINTSGNPFRDHACSMDLCMAALTFCYDNVRPGGHFVCKFYQGVEEKLVESRLRKLFTRVHREKPSSSRSESREAYFVALKRVSTITRDEVLRELN